MLMDHSVNILNELQSISPEVARINRQLPYQAPAGYFETLAAQVMQRIRAEEEALPPVLQAVADNPFTVPDGYFEGLAAQLLQRVREKEEPVSPILQQAGANPYTVPDGYFDQLPGVLLMRIKAAEETLTAQEELAVLSPLLSGLDKKLLFHTPAGYFTELTDNVVSGAKAIDFVNEELENLSPVMAALRDKEVFAAPAGYFDQLPVQILDRVKKMAEPAKVVSISFRRKVMQYASAAAVIGIVVMAAWWFTGKPDTTVPDPVAAKVETISEDELQRYLDDQSVPLPVDQLAVNTKAEIDASNMTDMFQDVSDEEIQKYLEQNMLTKNIATN